MEIGVEVGEGRERRRHGDWGRGRGGEGRRGMEGGRHVVKYIHNIFPKIPYWFTSSTPHTVPFSNLSLFTPSRSCAFTSRDSGSTRLSGLRSVRRSSSP